MSHQPPIRKTCSKCGSDGPFYASLKTICRECHKAHLRSYYVLNRDQFRARDAAMPLAKRAARKAVANAIRDGRMAVQVCFMCGDHAEAHHASYEADARLDVTWLCRSHHRQAHAT